MAVSTPFTALNLSGRITTGSAARFTMSLPPLTGRIAARSFARITGTARLSGRIKTTSTANSVHAAALKGRIRTSSAARSVSAAPLKGRIKTTGAVLRVTPHQPLSGRIGTINTARAIGTSPVLAPQRISARTSARADPLYLARPFAGRIKTTLGVSGATFVLPTLRGRIKTTANIRAATNVTPRNLAGRIAAKTTAHIVGTATLFGNITTKVAARSAAYAFGGLAGRISATSAFRANITVPVTVTLTGLITATSASRATPAPMGTIFLSGSIKAVIAANTSGATLSAPLSGRTASTTGLRNSAIQPLITLRSSRIITAVRAELLTSELLEPLPPYPLPFPTHPVEYYIDYITSEHNQKPKYIQTVAASIDSFVEDQLLVAGIPGLFDLDYSHGEQEDFTGQWIGKSRWIEIPNVFFSWDYEGVGWNQANWRGPFDSSDKLQRLDDYHFRLLLYAAVIANHWDGSIPKAYEAWDTLFHWTGLKVVIQDYGNMSMMYGLLWDREPDMVLISLFTSGHMDLKPEGIQLLDYVFQSQPSVPFFGFDGQSDALSGWDSGYWGILVPPGSNYIPI
jgi:hypothetical protein